MKIIVSNSINFINEEYHSYPIVNEEKYRKALVSDVSYEENQEKWISLLAFKEALSDLKVNLDQNISTIFIFDKSEKKMALLNILLERYELELLIL